MVDYFRVKAMTTEGAWLLYETDNLVKALEKFKFYLYAGHEKIRIFYNENARR
jgi:hypothetical protein